MNPNQEDRSGILAAGNWIVDHVKVIDTWPAQDALASIQSQTNGNGGCPYNVLTNLAKLGCDLPLSGVGVIGDDADGDRILADCAAHKIDVSGLKQTSAAATSYTDVMTVASSGRRTFFHQRGANALLDLEHFDLPSSRALIFQLGYLCLLDRLDRIEATGMTGAARLFSQARSLGMLTVADLVSAATDDFAAVITPSLPHVDYLFLNELELARLVGSATAPRHRVEMETQARLVLERGVNQAVIAHEPRGVLLVQRSGTAQWQGSVRLPPAMIAGTAGAGDALGAGFLFGLLTGWDLPRCLELAVCAAAASLRHSTCSEAVASWQDCLHLGKRFGFN